MRLIDADALKEIYSGNGTFTEAHFRTAINEQPTIIVAPVRRGKWIIKCRKGELFVKIFCSNCGFYCQDDTYRYCPDCGAKMEE